MAEEKDDVSRHIRLEELDDGTVHVAGLEEGPVSGDSDALGKDSSFTEDGDAGGEELLSAEEEAGLSSEERANRNRARRQRQKEARERKEAEIAALKLEVAEAKKLVSERFAGLEATTLQNQVGQIDNRLRELDQTEAYARQKYRQAISDSDGAVADEALAVLNKIQAEKGQAWAYREQTLAQVNQFRQMQEYLATQPAQPQPGPQQFSDLATAHAQSWAKNNSWFVPGGSDPDSKIAMSIESKLYAEGSNPEDPEHWEKLNSELKRHLPHRFNGAGTSRRGPMVGGSSDALSVSGRGTVTLPKAFVDGLKDAGIWDNSELRNKAIKNYRAGLAKR